MPSYSYQGRDQGGKFTRGVLDAADPGAVAARLAEMGVTPVRIEPAAVQNVSKPGGGGGQITLFDRFRKVQIEELIIFCRQMRTLTKSGVPVNRAVRGIAGMSDNPLLKESLEKTAADLETGTMLSTCLSRHPKVFDKLFVNLIFSGESSGNLENVFQQLSEHLELERETKARIKSATRYPTFVLVSFGVAIAILTLFVIPAFETVFAGLGHQLPWQTRLLMATSAFAVAWWPWILGGAIFGVFMFKRWTRTEIGMYKWGRTKLRLPVVGEIYERIALGRFASVFAMMLRAGVPITQAIRIVADASGNRYVGENIRGMAAGIERGEMLTRTAADAGLFTPLVIQMVAVGEETGAVDTLLDEVAEFYEQEVDYKLKRLVDAIEPIMAIGLGVLVLILALGIFLPLWELSAIAK